MHSCSTGHWLSHFILFLLFCTIPHCCMYLCTSSTWSTVFVQFNSKVNSQKCVEFSKQRERETERRSGHQIDSSRLKNKITAHTTTIWNWSECTRVLIVSRNMPWLAIDACIVKKIKMLLCVHINYIYFSYFHLLLETHMWITLHEMMHVFSLDSIKTYARSHEPSLNYLI